MADTPLLLLEVESSPLVPNVVKRLRGPVEHDKGGVFLTPSLMRVGSSLGAPNLTQTLCAQQARLVELLRLG